MRYTAPLDGLAKAVTTVITLMFIFSIYQCLSLFSISKKPIDLIAVALIVSIYCIVYGFKPSHYTVTPDQIIIHRMIRDISINRSDIISIERVVNSWKPMGWRLFGVGGLFGYFGKFVFFKIGRVNLYATNKQNLVLISLTNRKKIILSPKDPEAFIHQIQS